jgi:putative copper resistance protein D
MQGLADFADSLLGGALLVALSLVLGGVVWGLLVLRAGRPGADAAAVRRCVALLGAGAAALALGQIASLALKVFLLSSYVGADVLAVFAATLQFRAGTAHAALAATLAVAAAWLHRRPAERVRWMVVTLLAALVAGSGAWLVHAAARLEERAPLMALTVLHQVGAAVWVGGLLHLGALWRLARRDPRAAALWPETLARFSRVAIGSLVVLLVAATPLTWTYVGSWEALVGTGYGSLVLTKTLLMGVALLLAAVNFLAAHGGQDGALAARVPSLVGAETLLLVVVLFAAATLSSQPPPADTRGDRATWADIVEVFRPKWPMLRTPSMDVMQREDSEPAALVGGERTRDDYLWSNFTHNVAGLFLLAMSLLALAARTRHGTWARHWPLGLVALAGFVFLRAAANDATWPFGPRGFWEPDSESLQHGIGAILATAIGLVEWRARTSARPGRVVAYVFPVLAAGGGVLLLTHSHAAFEAKSDFLVRVTHTTMGALAVLMGCARLLEMRLPAPAGRIAGTASTVAMALIALVLVFYREANVVIPPDVAAASHAVAALTKTPSASAMAARAARPDQRRGRNLGSVTSGVTSSKTTSTGMPTRISGTGQSTRFETRRAPSSSAITTTAYGTSLAKPG